MRTTHARLRHWLPLILCLVGMTALGLVLLIVAATPAGSDPPRHDQSLVSGPLLELHDADLVDLSPLDEVLRLRVAVHVQAQQEEWYRGVLAEQARQAKIAADREQAASAMQGHRSAPVGGSGRCGGDLPPCSVMQCESGGNIRAENPNSSASGKWQMLISTSNNLARQMGRPDLVGVPASQWTEAEQDQAARILYAGGRGRGHWVC